MDSSYLKQLLMATIEIDCLLSRAIIDILLFSKTRSIDFVEVFLSRMYYVY